MYTFTMSAKYRLCMKPEPITLSLRSTHSSCLPSYLNTLAVSPNVAALSMLSIGRYDKQTPNAGHRSMMYSPGSLSESSLLDAVYLPHR